MPVVFCCIFRFFRKHALLHRIEMTRKNPSLQNFAGVPEDKCTLTVNNKNAKPFSQSCLKLTIQRLVIHHSHENVMFSHNILAICPHLA